MGSFTVSSSSDGRKLVFSNLAGEQVDVSCGDSVVFAKKRVYLYTDAKGVAKLFKRMASKWRGWSGSLEFSSIEGDLFLSASTDALGHVQLVVHLRNYHPDDDWEVTIPIHLEAGSLERYANEAKQYFNQ